MIRFNVRKIGKLDIARPTWLEIAALGLVLCFFLLIVVLWR